MKILYVTYENLYKTAILQAMVVKPLDLLSKKYKIKFIITSSVKAFENDEVYKLNKKYTQDNTSLVAVEFKKKLSSTQSIFTFLKDIFPMLRFSIKEAKRCDIIHCRSYGGAMIGLVASVITNKPFIFDMRGVLPEEMVDMGKISEDSLKFKLLKLMEKVLIKKCAYVITVSDKFNYYIKNSFNKKSSININNPTDFNVFYKKDRSDKTVTFIYSGSMHQWHLPELTIEYFSKIQKKFGNRVFLNFCTNDINKAESIFQKFNIPEDSFKIVTVPYEGMAEYYAKSDIAFCLIKESFSKSVCFPVKFSEYVAANLHVLGNKNIGDIEEIIKKYNCGSVLENLDQIDKNMKEISAIVNKILNNEYKVYDREGLSFLDWNKEGIDNIYKIYNKILLDKKS